MNSARFFVGYCLRARTRTLLVNPYSFYGFPELWNTTAEERGVEKEEMQQHQQQTAMVPIAKFNSLTTQLAEIKRKGAIRELFL